MADISNVKCRIVPSTSELTCSDDYASKVFQRYVVAHQSMLLIFCYASVILGVRLKFIVQFARTWVPINLMW